MTSLPASLGITTPEPAGKVPGSYGWEAAKERLKLDRAQLLQRSQGRRRHSAGGKGPKTTLSWSCFVSVASVVLKGLCGQDRRELAQESRSSKVTWSPFQAGASERQCQASSTSGDSQSDLEATRALSHRQPLLLPAPHSLPCPRHLHPTCSDAYISSTSRRGPDEHTPPALPPCPRTASTALRTCPAASCSPAQRSKQAQGKLMIWKRFQQRRAEHVPWGFMAWEPERGS